MTFELENLFKIFLCILLLITGCQTTYSKARVDQIDAEDYDYPVRITYKNGETVDGTIIKIESERFNLEKLETQRIKIIDVSKIKSIRILKRSKGAGTGFMIGLGLGVLIGGALILGYHEDTAEDWQKDMLYAYSAIFALGFSLLGLIFGSVRGYRRHIFFLHRESINICFLNLMIFPLNQRENLIKTKFWCMRIWGYNYLSFNRFCSNI